jgi:hypothetical protein
MQPPRNPNAAKHNEPRALNAQEAIPYGRDKPAKLGGLVFQSQSTGREGSKEGTTRDEEGSGTEP